MSDDLSGFSLMDLFRSEADGQTALLSEGLMALEGDVGCRAIIRARPELVAKLDVEGLNHPVDVDTPEDYERLRRPAHPGPARPSHEDSLRRHEP